MTIQEIINDIEPGSTLVIHEPLPDGLVIDKDITIDLNGQIINYG